MIIWPQLTYFWQGQRILSSLSEAGRIAKTHDKVSDAEAKARADFDIRWKVALGIEVEDRPFAKSTLQPRSLEEGMCC